MKRTLACALIGFLVLAMMGVSLAESATGWDSSEISWRKNTEPVTLTAFLDYSWWPMDTWGNDETSQYITQQTGVSVDVTKATTGDGMELQLMLGAGTMPDLVYFARPDMDGLFQNPNVSYAYDDLINEYCPELMDLLDPTQLFLNTAPDGKVYSIKSHYFSDADWADPRNVAGPGSGGLHIRKDIYEAIGSPDISSIEGIEAMYATVKEKYPDMIVYLPYWHAYEILTGATPGIVKVGDQIKIGAAQPEFLDFLKLINGFVTKGYTSAEGFTFTYEQFLETIRSGKVFSASYNTLLSDEENNFIKANALEGEWMPYAVTPTFKGVKAAKTNYQSIGWSSLYITKNCKTPDRAIMLFEYLKSPDGDATAQFGVEGEHWTRRDDGYISRTERFNSLGIEQAGVGPGYGLWCFGASGLNESILNSSIALNNPEFCTALDLQKEILTYIDRDPLVYYAVPKGGTDEYETYSKIIQYITDTRTALSIAKDDAEFGTLYTEFIDRMNAYGLADIEAYMTAEYNAAVASYAEFTKTLN